MASTVGQGLLEDAFHFGGLQVEEVVTDVKAGNSDSVTFCAALEILYIVVHLHYSYHLLFPATIIIFHQTYLQSIIISILLYTNYSTNVTITWNPNRNATVCP